MLKTSRYILLLVLLFTGAFQALAQMSSPDQVCLGTSRKYWVFGLPNSIYTWKVNGVIQGSTTDSFETIWDVAGTFTVEVQEHQDLCLGDVQSILVTVWDLPSAPVALVSPQPTCYVPTGTLVVTTPAEGSGYSYSLDGGTSWVSTATFTGLLPGSYSVIVQETASGCISPATVVTVDPLPIPPAPQAAVTVHPNCLVPAGTLVVTDPAEGTGYSYSLDGGTSWVPSATFTGLVPGNYSVTVKNILTGCESPATLLTVNPVPPAPPAPVAGVTVQPTCTLPTGTITVTDPAEGSGYTYSMDGGTSWVSTAIFGGLPSGSYTVTVQETATGCVSPGLALTVDAIPSITTAPIASVTVQPTCPVPTGTIAVTDPAEGTGYTYSIDGGTSWVGTATFSGLSPGTVQVRVQQTSTGCESPAETVTVNPLPVSPVVVASVTQQPDCIDPKGTIVVTGPVEGTGYEYSIDGGVSWSSNATFAGLSSGDYPVMVQETATSCKSPAVVLNVHPYPEPPTASVIKHPDCPEPTGTILVTIPPENTGFVYSVDHGANWLTSPILTGVPPGVISVTIKDIFTGCESPGTFLTVNPIPDSPSLPVASVILQPDCPVPTGTILVSSPPEGSGYSYSVDGGTVWKTTATFTGLSSGSYTILVLETASGCVSPGLPLTVDAVPDVPPAPIASATFQPTCPVPTGTITVTVPAEGSGFTYSIDSGTTWVSTAMFTGLSPGKYSVMVQESGNGCESFGTLVTVDPLPPSPPAPVASVTVQPDCIVPTGTILVTDPAEGTGYEYSRDGGVSWINSATFTGLKSGDYSVIVRETATSCISPAVVLNVHPYPEPPTASVIKHPDCPDPTGTIKVTIPEENSGFKYSVDHGLSWFTSSVLKGVPPGLISVTIKDDITGCESTGTLLTVNPLPASPPAPVASVTVHPTCTVPSATIVVSNPAQGSGFRYSINGGTTWVNTATFAGLSPGSYTVIVQETASLCVSPGLSLTVNPDPLAPSTPVVGVTVQPSCPVPTGTLVVSTPAEGSGYNYSIDLGTTWASSATFTGLSPGIVQVMVQETVTGCKSPSAQVTVNPLPVSPPVPVASVTQQPNCLVSAGSIVVTKPAEGTGYEYSIDAGASWNSNATFTGLSPGDYSVMVQETVTSCKSPALSLTVDPVPAAPDASLIKHPDCPDPTGTIAVALPKNTGYSYSIDAGVNWSSDPLITGLPPGKVSVFFQDTSTGCASSTIDFTVSAVPASPLVPVASVAVQPSCTVPDGTLVVTAPSQGSGYSYSIDGGTSWKNTATFAGLASGNYTVMVRETATSCVSPGLPLTVNPVPAAAVVPVAGITKQPNCPVPTGTLVFTVPAAGSGYRYSTDGGKSWAATPVFSGLLPGTYPVLVQEIATGCLSAGDTLTVNPVPAPPPAPTVQVTQQPNCPFPTGTLVFTVPAEGTGFTYSVDGGLTWTSTATFNGLLPGNYQAQVQDTVTGCESAVQVRTVNPVPLPPAAPVASVTVQPGCTIFTGTIVITVPAKGTGFTYSINGGTTWGANTLYAGLLPGNYQVMVRATATGCESPVTTLTVNPAPVVPPAPVAAVTVQPGCTVPTGTIVVSKPAVSTGFTYSMNGGPYQASPVFSGLSPGPYQLKVKDLVFGCESPVTPLTVSPVPAPPSAPTAGVTAQPTCIIMTGTIEVTLPGVGTGYEYRINTGSYQTSATFSWLKPGIHRLQVRHTASGCESPVTQLTVNPVPGPPAAPQAQVSLHPTCDNPDGTVQVTSPKENTGFEYSINGADYQLSATFTGLKWGEHIVLTRQISTGCVSPPTKVKVNAIPPTPVVKLASKTDCLCFNGLGSISLQFTDVPNGIYTIDYDGGQFRNVSVTGGKATIPAAAGSYTNLIITAEGCISVNGLNVTVMQPAQIVIKESIIEVDLKLNRMGSIKLALSGGTGPYVYKWSTGATTSEIINLSDGTYSVVVTDAKGCTASKSITIPVPDHQPVAVNDAYDSGCYGVEGFLTDNDFDPDGDLFFLDALPFKNPSHGTVTLDPATGHFSYLPNAGYSGPEQFEYAIYDAKHYLGDTATVLITVIADFDCDNVPDDVDVDADNDGIPLTEEGGIDADSDGDGFPNYLDIDSDNDGIPDNIEAQSLANYMAPLNTDSDKDGMDDAYDADNGGTAIVPIDTDKDSIPDFLDTDSDNDLVPDYIEGHDSNADGKPDHLLSGKDSDTDGLDDGFDTIDRFSSQANNMVGTNASMQDFEGDGASDWRDDNDDNDEYLTRFEDLNMDGNFSNDDIDFDLHPEYLDYGRECDLFIPEAFSPNNDNVHDYFQVYCIDHFPNAKMIIFDQMGNKVYEKVNYGNLDYWLVAERAWWDATTENRLVAMRGGKVPPGTYFYVLQLGNNDVKKGYVFVSY